MTTRVTVKFGMDEHTKTFDRQVTVGDVKRDNQIKVALGFGDSVRVVMNGIALPDDAVLQDGSRILVETAANQKAVGCQKALFELIR